MPRSSGGTSLTRAVVEPDLAVVGVIEAGDQPQQRRLAAARRTEEGEQLALLDREADPVDDGERPEPLGQVRNRDAHGRAAAVSAYFLSWSHSDSMSLRNFSFTGS